MQDFLHETKEYLDYCQKFLKRSPKTIELMEASYRIFLEYLDNRDVEQYSLEEIIQYGYLLSCRKGRCGHYSAGALASRLSHIKKFFQWCEENKGLKVLNWRLIKVPQNRSRRIAFLSQGEFTGLMRKLKVRRFSALRLKACCYVLASTGCRGSELIDMKVGDIDFEHHEVLIPRGKGGSLGVVFLNKEAEWWLKKYLKERKQFAPADFDWVWITKAHGCKRFSENNLWYQLHHFGESIHFHKTLYPHLFRHTFGTRLMQNGANIREVQELMRHRSINSTMIYTHVTNPNLRRAHNRFLKYVVFMGIAILELELLL